MKTLKIVLGIFLIFGLCLLNADDLITLKTRTSVEQNFLLLKPKNPLATVVLFTGGNGILDLTSTFGAVSINKMQNNFLVRTKDMFFKNNFVVALIDAPSDRQTKKGMLKGFRSSTEHLEDIEAVVKYLKNEIKLPIWLIGTSRGTESVGYVAVNTDTKLNGIILTSSMSIPNSKGLSVVEMDLEDIEIPTLIVSHKNDGCKKTPMSGSLKIKEMLTSSKKAKFLVFEGGSEKSKPCKGLSYHGFLGIEEKVVASISDFIKKN